MAVLVAAIMVVATMVPAWATTSASGRLDGLDSLPTSGTITIKNVEDGEKYSLYKIFDLYSFTDDNTAPNNHSATDERYSYMIASDSDWFTFIKTNYSNATANTGSKKYFEIDEANPITFNTKTYYFVRGINEFDTFGDDDVDSNTRPLAIADANIVQAFARDCLDFARKTGTYSGTALTPDAEKLADTTNMSGTTDLAFASQPLGYYLVGSTVGRIVGLDTNNTNVEIIEKNDVPSLTKNVWKRGGTGSRNGTSRKYESSALANWVANANYSIGEDIKFLLTVTIPVGAEGYTLHDNLEKGFTLNTTSFVAYAFPEDTAQNGAPVSMSADTINAVTEGNTDGCEITIVFNDNWLKNNGGKTVEIEYTAKLNQYAVIYGEDESSLTRGSNTTVKSVTDDDDTVIEGDPQNPKGITQIPQDYNEDDRNTNSAILTFGINSGRAQKTGEVASGTTGWAVATVDTFQFDVIKTQEAVSGTAKLLAGAQFELYEDDGTGAPKTTKMSLIQNKGTSSTYPHATESVWRPVLTGETAGTTIETSADKALNFEGLAAGTYYLKETKAPTGYNKIDGYWKIIIAPDLDTASTAVIPATNASAGKVTLYWVNGDPSSPTTTTIGDKKPIADITGDGTVKNYVEADNGGLQVVNKSGSELPSTGGMGTTVLYIVGGMLVVLAGAYLFFSRKRTA